MQVGLLVKKNWNLMMNCLSRDLSSGMTILDISIKYQIDFTSVSKYIKEWDQKGLICLQEALKMSQLIKGSQIYLKRLVVEDVSDEYVSWLNDDSINKYLECRFVDHTLESVKKYIQCLSKEGSDELIFGIYRDQDSKHIGNIKLGPINSHHQHAAVGLVIGDKNFWGYGYGSKAIKLLSDYAFESLSLESLNAGCYEQNIGSYMAFLKAGWEITGKIKSLER